MGILKRVESGSRTPVDTEPRVPSLESDSGISASQGLTERAISIALEKVQKVLSSHDTVLVRAGFLFGVLAVILATFGTELMDLIQVNGIETTSGALAAVSLASLFAGMLVLLPASQPTTFKDNPSIEYLIAMLQSPSGRESEKITNLLTAVKRGLEENKEHIRRLNRWVGKSYWCLCASLLFGVWATLWPVG
jgi:hypothetical protein